MTPTQIEFKEGSTYVTVKEQNDGYLLQARVLKYYCGPKTASGSHVGIQVREEYNEYDKALSRAEELIDITKTYMEIRHAHREQSRELDRLAREVSRRDIETADAYIEETLGGQE